MRRRGFAQVLPIGFFALRANAVEPSVLDYTAPSVCPSRQTFLAEIDRRLPNAVDRATGSSISVRIVAEESGRFSGELDWSDPTSGREVRKISGESCSDVASALALVTALALQAKLSTSDVTEPKQPPRAPPPVTTKPPLPSPSQDVESSSPASGFELGAHLGLASMYGPKPAPTLQAFAGIDLRAVDVRLWLAYAASTETQTSLGRAAFDWFGGRPTVCVLMGRTLRTGACGGFEIGYLRGRGQPGQDLGETRDRGSIWLAPGAFVPLDWALSARWHLEALGGVEFPLYRERFTYRFADGTEDLIYRAPWAGWAGSLGVAYVAK